MSDSQAQQDVTKIEAGIRNASLNSPPPGSSRGRPRPNRGARGNINNLQHHQAMASEHLRDVAVPIRGDWPASESKKSVAAAPTEPRSFANQIAQAHQPGFERDNYANAGQQELLSNNTPTRGQFRGRRSRGRNYPGATVSHTDRNGAYHNGLSSPIEDPHHRSLHNEDPARGGFGHYRQAAQLDPNVYSRGIPFNNQQTPNAARGLFHLGRGHRGRYSAGGWRGRSDFVRDGISFPWNPYQQPTAAPPAVRMRQSEYLEEMALFENDRVRMSDDERKKKDDFRQRLFDIFSKAISEYAHGFEYLQSFDLQAFGSFASGCATRGSDLDLTFVTPVDAAGKPFEMPLGLQMEIAHQVLNQGMGARLLTKTRVPILKVCERPGDELHQALIEAQKMLEAEVANIAVAGESGPRTPTPEQPHQDPSVNDEEIKSPNQDGSGTPASPDPPKTSVPKPRNRLRPMGKTDFPRDDSAGLQCDVNFATVMGLHNTHLIRCYVASDPRVQPMITFVKTWASCRGINSSYSGTMCSYGWTLLVLHYLVNVVELPVLKNLQLAWKPEMKGPTHEPSRKEGIEDYDVRFWRDENAIHQAAMRHEITTNNFSLGRLLRGFFYFYANPNSRHLSEHHETFNYGDDVLSLRTPGGKLSKYDKGWTGKTMIQKDGKQVQNRYLLRIEDPFEHDHNVARTVDFQGLAAIRSEFERAWQIVSCQGTQHADQFVEAWGDLVHGPIKHPHTRHHKPQHRGGAHLTGPRKSPARNGQKQGSPDSPNNGLPLSQQNGPLGNQRNGPAQANGPPKANGQKSGT